MKKILLLLLFTLTFLFSSQMGMVHSLDPNGDGFLSIRAKPKQAEIGKLYNGDKVQILSKKGKYYKIKKMSNGQVGYAHSNWIRKTSSTATASNSSSSKSGVVIGLDPNGDGFLSLRSKPKGREIGKLYNGDKLSILESRGKWVKVKTASAGQVGWAHGNWVRVNNFITHDNKNNEYIQNENEKFMKGLNKGLRGLFEVEKEEQPLNHESKEDQEKSFLKAIKKLYPNMISMIPGNIKLIAPTAVSNSDSIPISVSHRIPAKSMAIFQNKEAPYLIVVFKLNEYTVPDYKFKIKLREDSLITIIVEGEDGKFYKKETYIVLPIYGG